MRIKTRIYLLLFFLPLSTLKADLLSLEKDISDGYLDKYSKIETAFILSGITNPDSLVPYILWYDNVVAKVKSFALDADDPVGSAQTVFMYLHSEWLKSYAMESTTIADIVRRREYNCVSATILFNIICEEFNWPCEAFETPTHVYTILNDHHRKIIVENTSNMGFDIMKNLKAYSRYLAQYYPENEVLRIGLDRLYLHENSKGRIINNVELLGLLAYNRAYLARKNKDFEAAYEYVLLAQKFNNDSRSNVNFEIGLYYDWGRQQYMNNNYSAAFAVFADGYYRYPENKDFINNTFTSFYKSLYINWKKKNWPDSTRLIEEMMILEIFEEKDYNKLNQILSGWRQYFSSKKDDKLLKEVNEVLERLDR